MPEATPLQYGAHPGLRFACTLDGRGGCRDLGWSDVEAWRTDAGVLWIHIERDDPRAQTWMRERSGIDPLIVESLLAEESRPRVERPTAPRQLKARAASPVSASAAAKASTTGLSRRPPYSGCGGAITAAPRPSRQRPSSEPPVPANTIVSGPCVPTTHGLAETAPRVAVG